jgi:hypothetical protein
MDGACSAYTSKAATTFTCLPNPTDSDYETLFQQLSHATECLDTLIYRAKEDISEEDRRYSLQMAYLSREDKS